MVMNIKEQIEEKYKMISNLQYEIYRLETDYKD